MKSIIIARQAGNQEAKQLKREKDPTIKTKIQRPECGTECFTQTDNSMRIDELLDVGGIVRALQHLAVTLCRLLNFANFFQVIDVRLCWFFSFYFISFLFLCSVCCFVTM